MQIIKMLEIAEGRDVLTGLFGRRLYPKMVERLSDMEAGSNVLVDFQGVKASGSFFGQAIIPFREYALRYGIYPILGNIDEETEGELKWFTELSPDAFLVCRFDGKVTRERWIGVLEEKQLMTFNAVMSEGSADAGSLARKFEGEKIGVTGWNNRLASLASKGLIIEFKNGRGKGYKPVLNIKD